MRRQNLTNGDFLMQCRPFSNIVPAHFHRTLIYQLESCQVINRIRQNHSHRIVLDQLIVGLSQVNPRQLGHQGQEPAKMYVHEEIHGNRTY